MNRRLRRKVRVGVHSTAEERTKIGKTLIIALVVLTAVVILTVVWGNHLKEKAADSEEKGGRDNLSVGAGGLLFESSSGQATFRPSGNLPASVPVVRARYVILSSSAHIDWSARAADYKKNGVTALSLVLYYGGGKVNFESKIAQAMSYQPSDTSTTNLNEAIGVLDVAGIYTSGCFYVNHTSKSTSGLVCIYRAYEAALAAEAAGAGISDILIFGFGAGEVSEAQAFIDEVRGLNSSATLGIALGYNEVSASSADKIFADLAASASFLALDFSEIRDGAVLMSEIEKASGYIKDYNLRLVISDTLMAAAEDLADAGYDNWQMVP